MFRKNPCLLDQNQGQKEGSYEKHSTVHTRCRRKKTKRKKKKKNHGDCFVGKVVMGEGKGWGKRKNWNKNGKRKKGASCVTIRGGSGGQVFKNTQTFHEAHTQP